MLFHIHTSLQLLYSYTITIYVYVYKHIHTHTHVCSCIPLWTMYKRVSRGARINVAQRGRIALRTIAAAAFPPISFMRYRHHLASSIWIARPPPSNPSPTPDQRVYSRAWVHHTPTPPPPSPARDPPAIVKPTHSPPYTPDTLRAYPPHSPLVESFARFVLLSLLHISPSTPLTPFAPSAINTAATTTTI